MTGNTQYDSLGTRYRLGSSNASAKYNWLCLPGGPGVDSDYFKTLLQHVTLPGKTWLVDFPGNGDNIRDREPADYDFEQWAECLINTVNRFENPILIGHSFGGMYPLLFPELEDLLSGFIILSSAPCLWMEEATKLATENNISVFTDDLQAFEDNPNQETFEKALMTCMPYYFPPHTLDAGKAILENIPLNYHAAVWWLKKAVATQFSAQWIPQKVPTLILGGSHDFITPISLFERDKRFHRENITIKKIEQAGHFPWVEDPNAVTQNLEHFQSRLLRSEKHVC